MATSAVSLATLDIVALVAYFVIVFGIGFWATSRANTASAFGYFLAGKSTHWILVGASTFATNIGAPMFVGHAGSAAAQGIVGVMFEWHAMFMLIALGWIFLPVYRASGCYTMPQYLQLRFGGQRIRLFLAVVHTFTTIIAGIAGQMYAGALFIQQIFQWNLYLAVVLVLVITALYTIIGGLTAVLWTDAIQTVILVAGSIVLSTMSLIRVGGFEGMRESYGYAYSNLTYVNEALYDNHSCGLPSDDAFHIFRPAGAADYPWPGMTIGLTILATNAWCTDQLSVQRSLSAKSVTHAKGGVLLAAYLKILSFFFFVIPGMISRVLYPDEVSCSDPDTCEAICENRDGCTNIAYPLLVIRILPDGVRGVMLAALMAALMSSLTSIFNSSSTIFTLDIWARLRPRAAEGELMVVGRLFTLVLVVVSVGWLPVLQAVQGARLLDYTQSINSYILPPIVTCFLLGIFWPRATEQGAFAGLLLGVVIGLIRMVLSWVRTGPLCGTDDPDNRWSIITDVHYLHFAIILLIISIFIVICVSLITKPRPKPKLRRVTFWSREDPEPQEVSDTEEEREPSAPSKGADSSIDSTRGMRCQRFLKKWICGVDDAPKKLLTTAEMVELQKKATNINEPPKTKLFLDCNAVMCAAVCIFLHAFWA